MNFQTIFNYIIVPALFGGITYTAITCYHKWKNAEEIILKLNKDLDDLYVFINELRTK